MSHQDECPLNLFSQRIIYSDLVPVLLSLATASGVLIDYFCLLDKEGIRWDWNLVCFALVSFVLCWLLLSCQNEHPNGAPILAERNEK